MPNEEQDQPPVNKIGLDELRIKVAELCGWWIEVVEPFKIVRSPNSPEIGFCCGLHLTDKECWQAVIDDPGATPAIPDFPFDLNACAEFEKGLSWEQGIRYRLALAFNSDGRNATFTTVEAALCHATAEQRCRAFIATMEDKT